MPVLALGEANAKAGLEIGKEAMTNEPLYCLFPENAFCGADPFGS